MLIFYLLFFEILFYHFDIPFYFLKEYILANYSYDLVKIFYKIYHWISLSISSTTAAGTLGFGLSLVNNYSIIYLSKLSFSCHENTTRDEKIHDSIFYENRNGLFWYFNNYYLNILKFFKGVCPIRGGFWPTKSFLSFFGLVL